MISIRKITLSLMVFSYCFELFSQSLRPGRRSPQEKKLDEANQLKMHANPLHAIKSLSAPSPYRVSNNDFTLIQRKLVDLPQKVGKKLFLCPSPVENILRCASRAPRLNKEGGGTSLPLISSFYEVTNRFKSCLKFSSIKNVVSEINKEEEKVNKTSLSEKLGKLSIENGFQVVCFQKKEEFIFCYYLNKEGKINVEKDGKIYASSKMKHKICDEKDSMYSFDTPYAPNIFNGPLGSDTKIQTPRPSEEIKPPAANTSQN